MAGARDNSTGAAGPASTPPAGPADLWTEGTGRLAVRIEVLAQGPDLLVRITGGKAHVGAVAVSGQGLHGEDCEGLLVVPGHKEGPLARAAARELARASGRTCVVVAGIHQDAATREEIAAIVANVRRGIESLAQRYCKASEP